MVIDSSGKLRLESSHSLHLLELTLVYVGTITHHPHHFLYKFKKWFQMIFYILNRLKLYLQSETVHVGVEQHLNKWDHQGEDQVDIYHLDVGGGWQAVAHIDEECGQHQHGGQVHCHRRLEEERFEEGGGVADHVEQHGGHEGGQDDG